MRLQVPLTAVAAACVLLSTPIDAQNPVILPPAITPQARLVSASTLRLTGQVDSNSPAVWDLIDGVPQLFVMTSYAGRPSTARGSTLTRLGVPRPIELDAWPIGGVWMEAVVSDVDGTWYGYYHNEIPAEEVCPGGNKVIPRIGAARSRDHGQTWEQLGIILEAPASAFLCAANGVPLVNGVGDFSVQLDSASRDVYFFVSQYERSLTQQGVAVARLAWADRDAPAGKVMVWRTRFWVPAARELASDDGEPTWSFGAGVPIFSTTDGWYESDASTDAFWGPSVHWNTYLQLYVMLLSRAKDTGFGQEGVYVSFSPRLNDPRLWSAPNKILSGGSWYPQVIGLEDGTGSDKVAGERARFFMAGTSQYVIQFSK